MPLEGKDGWDSSAKPEISGVSPDVGGLECTILHVKCQF